MTAGNEYSQTVEKSFHISMAALDLSKSKGKVVLYFIYDISMRF